MLLNMIARLGCKVALLLLGTGGLASVHGANVPDNTPTASAGGIVFECPGRDLDHLSAQVLSYFHELGLADSQILQSRNAPQETLTFTLNSLDGTNNTLGLINRPELELKEELVALPSTSGKTKYVLTVSRKEILAAMLQPGRTTRFSHRACSIETLADQIGIRQNIVAWADSVEWKWPDGSKATWNRTFWRNGNFNDRHPLHEALMDVFTHAEKYSFGCYTASKLVLIQGILDYYRRIKQDKATAALIERRLLEDKNPLQKIEPGSMWSFDRDTDADDLNHQGKLVYLQRDVPPYHFIPGDWIYIVNSDALTNRKRGYEGSNAIYLGRGKFDDFYNDNNHSYTHREKISEVYQWRNRVFSRSRDIAHIVPLTAKEIDHLSRPPEQGGLQFDYRAVPYQFGFEALPDIR
jgi:hypothetical protein